MHIKIHNQHPFQTVRLQGGIGGQGDIVKQAKAHAPAARGVVAGRAQQPQTVVQTPLQHSARQVYQSTGGL